MICDQRNHSQPGVAVAMIGSRRHFAVPALLDRSGLLSHFYTDFCPQKGLLRWSTPLLKPLGRNSAFKRMAGRRCEVELAKTTVFNWFGLVYWWKLRRARSTAQTEAIFLWAGETFSDLVRTHLHPAHTVYAFNGSAQELFRHCRARHMTCVLDQTRAPHRIYEQVMTVERDLWPGWETHASNTCSEAMAARESAEWGMADLILAGSQYVVDELSASGVPNRKCRVVPYGVDVHRYRRVSQVPKDHHPLHVLFLGSVGLRKGIPYLLQAAAKLSDSIIVRIVGPLNCAKDRVTNMAPHNTTICGPVPRSEVGTHLEWADVLCLPSLCEGSASVTYEALAAGLPVICTHNTGSVVRNGRDGYIIPIRDSEAIADRIETLVHDQKLLRDMSQSARARAEEYSWDRYGERLADAVTNILETV